MSAWSTALVGICLALGGCERAMHDMYEQPKNGPLSPNALFADGNSARVPPAGSIAIAAGAEAESSGGRLGHVAPPIRITPALALGDDGQPLAAQSEPMPRNPTTPTLAVLTRGRERFDIYCAPCHGRSGDGEGMIVRRGFPAPPSYHEDKLRNAADGHFFRVISDGYGAMYGYADRITPLDRWAIVDYVRALQLGQHAPRALLQSEDLRALAASVKAAPSAPAQVRP